VSDIASIGRMYRLFAEREARGRSHLYEELALEASKDRATLEVLAALPPVKRQPNLLLGAVKYLHGTVTGWPEFRALLEEDRSRIVEVMLARRTQTNEPARCATLVPLLALLPPPLALLEVGAAAGLCLLPDCYGYDYDGRHVAPSVRAGVPAPVFRCHTNAATPIPPRNLDVVWRAGVDVEPVDLGDRDAIAWLEALVWPGEERRLEPLRAAIELARIRPPGVRSGDLATDVPALLAEAPAGATAVVFHTAVLPYLSGQERAAFAKTARDLLPHWIANEGPRLQPMALKRLTTPVPQSGEFLLSLNGRPMAWTDPHGSRIEWLG
jgi:hypothetical protein